MWPAMDTYQGGIMDDPAEVAQREKEREDNFPAICIDCPSGLDPDQAALLGGGAQNNRLEWNEHVGADPESAKAWSLPTISST